MADILIRGISLPVMPEIMKQGENVPYIDVRVFADGSAVTSKGDHPYYAEHTAKELPPHGRLIDADKLERGMRQMAKHQTGERQQGILGCCETIRLAETIIPAD